MSLTQITTGGVDENINIDSNTLKVDGTNNRVGIGTSSPSKKLHIVPSGSNAYDAVQIGDGLYLGNTSNNNNAALFHQGGGADLEIGSQQHITFTTGDIAGSATERMRIDSSGRLLVGTSSAQTLPTASRFQVSGTDFATSSIRQTRFESGTSGPSIILAHARGSEASNQSLGNGDELGKIRFHGHDGTDFNNLGAEIIGEVDGTPGSNDMPGRLLFRTTADGANAATERMRINSSGNLGLGTSSPSARLDVRRGDADGLIAELHQSGGYGINIKSSQSVATIQAEANQALTFETGSSATERLRIDSSGRLLLGTTTEGLADGNNLTIADSGPCGITLRSGSSSGGAIYFSDATSGSGEYAGFVEYLHSSDALRFATGGTERMRIDSSGNVGIGAASPAAKLDVAGNQLFSAANPQIQFNAGGPIIRLPSANTLAFLSDSSNERMRIDSSGRLLVGTSTNLSSAGGVQIYNSSPFLIGCKADNNPAQNAILMGMAGFSQSGTSFNQAAFVRCESGGSTSSGNHPGQIVFGTTATGTSPTERFKIDSLGRVDHFSSDGNGYDLHHAETGSTDIAFALKNGATDLDTGTVVLKILADGDLENTNNRYTQISDVKFKENIADASSQWNDLKTIRVVNFNFKEELKWGTHKQIGVVAQEIEAVSPGLVCQRKEENGEEYKSVAYSVLYMKAIKALQEAMERIETLETKVAALEAG